MEGAPAAPGPRHIALFRSEGAKSVQVQSGPASPACSDNNDLDFSLEIHEEFGADLGESVWLDRIDGAK